MEVYIFGVIFFFCVVNFVLRRIVCDNVKGFSFEVFVIVERNFYVDDVLLLFSDEDFVIKGVFNLVEILGCGGFCLIKFMFNSKDVMFIIFVERRVLLDFSFYLDELLVERVFGVCWFV